MLEFNEKNINIEPKNGGNKSLKTQPQVEITYEKFDKF